MRIKFSNSLAVYTFVSVSMILAAVSCKEEEFTFYGNLYGMITDADDKEPIKGAEVVLSPGNKTAVTGDGGHYEFQNLDAEQYKITVSSAGYKTNSRQVTVVSGETVICDMQLVKEEEEAAFELSSTSLDFGLQRDEMTFTIKNTGSTEKLSWTVSNITEAWLKVSPTEGTTDRGKTSSIKVIIDRKQISKDVTTTFNVNAAGGSQAVTVSVLYDDGSQNDAEMELSTNNLDFGTKYDELSFDIRNTGISESLEWTITNITVDWISVSPLEGSTAAGKSTSVKVAVDRSRITKDVNTVFTVEAGESSESVNVSVEYFNPDDENPSMELSVSQLDFGTDYNELSFSIKNTAEYVNLDWEITGISVDWLTVSPMQGTTSAGNSASVKVAVDRSRITGDVNTVFTVEAGTLSKSVSVKVDYYNPYEDEEPSMELSTNRLDFGLNSDMLSLSIRNTASYVDLHWNVSDLTVDWLTISPMEGVTSPGNTSTLKVTVDRSKITSDANTSFNIKAGELSESVIVSVMFKEDYSSASVESGDSRIIAEIVSCKRSGSSVTLTYTLRNEGMGYINDFRIYTTNSNSLISGAYRTVISDDNYNSYIESDYTFNGQSTNHNYVLTATFPEGVNCKGTVVVKDFDRNAEKLNVILGVWPYDLYPDALADPRIYFENVPIY